MIKTFESYNSSITLVQQVWDLYNPALHGGEYTDLSSAERTMIKKIISLKNKGMDFDTIASNIPNTEDELTHAITVHRDDLIRRSFPQGDLQG